MKAAQAGLREPVWSLGDDLEKSGKTLAEQVLAERSLSQA